jgi:hypothetical protein
MSGYGDPSLERLSNGRSMTDLMRGGPKGLRGVVVAPSTPGGIPVNFNPHDRSKIHINVVDPDGSNLTGLSLSQMDSRAVEQAMASAAELVPGNDINSIRERTAVAFEELAKIAKSNVQRVPVKTAASRPPVLRPPKPEPAEVTDDGEEQVLSELEHELEQQRQMTAAAQSPPIEKIDRNYSPMAAFGLKRQTLPAQQTVSAPAQKSGPPQKLVYFEKEGIGTVPAFFHDVIISISRKEPDSPEESGFIVLIYDLRFEQNAARWFPPSNDPYQRPWAAQISDDRRLYLVHTTGFQYVYDNREYCVLLVERALRADYEE